MQNPRALLLVAGIVVVLILVGLNVISPEPVKRAAGMSKARANNPSL